MVYEQGELTVVQYSLSGIAERDLIGRVVIYVLDVDTGTALSSVMRQGSIFDKRIGVFEFTGDPENVFQMTVLLKPTDLEEEVS